MIEINAIEDAFYRAIFNGSYKVLWIVRFTERNIDLTSDIPELSRQFRQ